MHEDRSYGARAMHHITTVTSAAAAVAVPCYAMLGTTQADADADAGQFQGKRGRFRAASFPWRLPRAGAGWSSKRVQAPAGSCCEIDAKNKLT